MTLLQRRCARIRYTFNFVSSTVSFSSPALSFTCPGRAPIKRCMRPENHLVCVLPLLFRHPFLRSGSNAAEFEKFRSFLFTYVYFIFKNFFKFVFFFLFHFAFPCGFRYAKRGKPVKSGEKHDRKLKTKTTRRFFFLSFYVRKQNLLMVRAA